MGIKGRVIVLVMLVSTSASADRRRRAPPSKAKSAAKVHMEKAAVASKEGRFADAITELEAAYAKDPQPMLLLALGHAHVKNNDCSKAIERYEQYLATNPNQDLADSATQAIESCKATLAPPPPPPTEQPKTMVTSEEINADDENPTLVGAPRPAPRVVDDAPAAQVDAPSGRSPFKDPILIGLGVGGVAGLAAGVVLYSSARGKLDDSESAATYDEARVLVDDARGLRTYSIVAGVAGAALVGGAVFYYLRAHGGDDERPRVTLVPTQRGGIVGWTGRF